LPGEVDGDNRMRMTCPGCGAEFTLDVLIAHDGAREALVEAMGLNLSLGKLLVQYLSLFRPAMRQLTMDRVASILKEIGPDIKAAQITRNGRTWSIPLESWKLGLEAIVVKRDKLTLPLKSHGYLYEMLIAAADKGESERERVAETRRASGAIPPGQSMVVYGAASSAASVTRTGMPDTVRQALRSLTKPAIGDNDAINT
jgi:hypothetical protein